MDVQSTDIQKFYRGSTVFLTGATGFIGKLLLEKVLRSLEVKKVFILVRGKKGVAASKRVNNVWESPIFESIKRTNNDVFDKVSILEGDITLPDLGLSKEDQQTFVDQVDVIFHCAATVRFDEHLTKATMTNVRATRNLVELAKKISKLKTFVYVGTAFSNSNRTEIKEEIYPAKISAERLIAACESLDEQCVQDMTKTLVDTWPNTYTFTKQVTEDYINRQAKNIPICICRPTIVISTATEPVSAFVDNLFTLAGFLMTTGMGLCRISYDKNINLDIVPADYVVNQCIAAGWQTGETFVKQRDEIPVYHMSSSLDNAITIDEVYGINDYYARQTPTTKLLAYPLYFRTSCRYNYLFLRFFMHTMVAFFLDLGLRVQGKPLMFMDGISKLHKFQEAFEHFTTTNFFMHTENNRKLLKKMSFEDRQLFNFDIGTVNWDNYFANYSKGVRFYLLRETPDSLPEAKEHFEHLRRVLIVALIVAATVIYCLGKIFLFRVVPLVGGLVLGLLRSSAGC